MAVISLDSATEAVRAAGRKASAVAVEHAADLVDQTRQLKTLAAESVENGQQAVACTVQRSMRRIEDARDWTGYRIKRAPFTAVAIACGAGILAGIAVAWLLTRSRSARGGND